jgi:transcriptional regulator with AAA-type ATPase domain
MKEGNSNLSDTERLSLLLPRILVIDDLFGRIQNDGRNPERMDLCGQFLIEDITRDLKKGPGTQKIKRPVAQVAFCRGQIPAAAAVGDVVENDLDGALAFVRRHWQAPDHGTRVSMVLLDLCFYTGTVTAASEGRRGKGMPEGRDGDDRAERYFGLRILEGLHDCFPDLPVVILSSMPRESVSQRFSRLGALGFLSRGDANSPDLLRDYLWRHGLIPDSSGTVIGGSKALLLALRAARRAAVSRKNVLIRGETGAGKELLARYLHDQTPHAQGKPLVTVDSGALSAALYGSELFGHRRGAFTGATHDRIGRIVQADGGDLFLDEIGNMPEDVQAGMLRTIEQKEVTPLGAAKSQKSDVRFITATNLDIEEMASTGRGFREDLYYRLREGGVIYLPPLRERKEDIPQLTAKFLREAESITPGALRRAIDPQVMEALLNHAWPGNVRELRNYILKAVNDHPDVEYLSSVHLHFASIPQSLAESRSIPSLSPKAELRPPPTKIEALTNLLDDFEVESLGPAGLAAKLPIVQAAYSRLVARLLLAAVNVTRRPTVEHPEGDIFIHPAMKLLSGDADLTASQAADLIKRLLRLDSDAAEGILSDETLAEVHRIAVRLRPRGVPKARK